MSLTLHSPIGSPPSVSENSLAPRLESLAKKTIYLVTIPFDNADVFMKELVGWFARNLAEVEVRVVAAGAIFDEEDPGLISKITKSGDAAIVGLGL